MAADLKESTATEEEAKAAFATLVSSKEEEQAAAKKAVEEKTARIGELAVSVAQGKADLEDTEDAKADDVAMKANLASSCSTKTEEFDKVAATRAEELKAISETIEMLNFDDALELFKKTLPSAPALLQLSAGRRLMRELAREPETKLLMLKARS